MICGRWPPCGRLFPTPSDLTACKSAAGDSLAGIVMLNVVRRKQAHKSTVSFEDVRARQLHLRVRPRTHGASVGERGKTAEIPPAIVAGSGIVVRPLCPQGPPGPTRWVTGVAIEPHRRDALTEESSCDVAKESPA